MRKVYMDPIRMSFEVDRHLRQHEDLLQELSDQKTLQLRSAKGWTRFWLSSAKKTSVETFKHILNPLKKNAGANAVRRAKKGRA